MNKIKFPNKWLLASYQNKNSRYVSVLQERTHKEMIQEFHRQINDHLADIKLNKQWEEYRRDNQLKLF